MCYRNAHHFAPGPHPHEAAPMRPPPASPGELKQMSQTPVEQTLKNCTTAKRRVCPGRTTSKRLGALRDAQLHKAQAGATGSLQLSNTCAYRLRVKRSLARLPPQRPPVCLVHFVHVDRVVVQVEVLREHAVAFHLANIRLTGPKVRHVEPLDRVQLPLGRPDGAENRLIVGTLAAR